MSNKLLGCFLTILLLWCSCLIPTGMADAYSLKAYKMNSSVWYQPSNVFQEGTRSSFRECMVKWNVYLPEWRRVCYNPTTFSGVYVEDTKDWFNGIYKQAVSDPKNLATNYIWYNKETFYVVESDIVINSNQPWYNGVVEGRYDVRTVFLHELGHTLGLGHSLTSNAVMFPTTPPNWARLTFTADDLNGLALRYS